MSSAERVSEGIALHQVGDLVAAERHYREALADDPSHPEALHLLGVLLRQRGELRTAIAYIRQAIGLNPRQPVYHYNLGIILDDLGELGSAEESYRQTLSLQPNHPQALANLGAVLRRSGRPGEAEVCYRGVLGFLDQNPVCLNNLGNALREQGRIEEALECFRQALAVHPHYARAHSNLLLTLQYLPGITANQLVAPHEEWQSRHAAPIQASWLPHDNIPDVNRPLRLGFVCAHLACHPVGKLSVRGLEAIGRDQCQLFFYCGDTRDGGLRPRFEAIGHWRTVDTFSDDDLANLIRRDNIDVLFDLSGHADGGRLLTFARKPAPVQISWLGYVGTTGLAAMDYVLADAIHAPHGVDVHYSEQILRLPRCYSCFDPPQQAPPVEESSWERNGSITFGGSHNPAKLNTSTLRTWAEVLRRIPGSRLHLRYSGLDELAVSDRYHSLLASHGIDLSRVELTGRSSPEELMVWYQQLDVVLDPFPYSGGVTTCESLWMGVPVVTILGETFAGRHAASYLHHVGLTDLIASDREGYVERAVWLATDHQRRLEIRTDLRARVESTLCDGVGFARDFVGAIYQVWREWCSERKNSR
ncbi:MAG: tetratricopeptide repeat protein [Gemmataceae bacterium]